MPPKQVAAEPVKPGAKVAHYPPLFPIRRYPEWHAHRRTNPNEASVRPTVAEWSRAFAGSILDAEAGRRDVRSLRRWMSTELYDSFTQRLSRIEKPTGMSKLAQPISTRVWEVRSGVYEVATTVWDRGQLRGVAIRVEDFRGRWIAVSLEYG